MACPDCGFDQSSVSPADAVVALRSFPRRFREVIEPPSPAGSGASGSGSGAAAPGASVAADAQRQAVGLDEAGQAAETIAALSDELRRVLVEDDPALGTTGEAATAVRNAGDPETALDRLTAATDATAVLADHQPGEAWSRTGTRPEGAVKAIDLLRDAVHAGVHHLRAAEAAMA